MRILITGVTGFVGGHLAEALRDSDGGELHGASRAGRWPASLDHLSSAVRLHALNWTVAASVDAVLSAAAPDQIYHLAGYAATGSSFAEPDAAWAGNLGVAQALFDAIDRWGGRPRIVFVTSALIYAPPNPPDMPIDENGPIAPLSPYAASKAAADRLAGEKTELEVVRVRPFNQIGPRQSPHFAIGSFSQQLARIELGIALPRLETGDLTSRRDFTDVRDMARAYMALMEHGQSGEAYNAGSGVAVAIADIVEWLRSACRVPVEVVTKAERLRPTDAPVLVADAGKLRAATGWKPTIPLSQSVADALEYWRNVERGS